MKKSTVVESREDKTDVAYTLAERLLSGGLMKALARAGVDRRVRRRLPTRSGIYDQLQLVNFDPRLIRLTSWI